MAQSDKNADEVRDVTDLSSNEAVEEEVDDMLGIPEDERPDRDLDTEDDADESEVSPDIQKQMDKAKEREENENSTQVTVSDTAEDDAPEEFDFENQDWDDLEKEPEVKEIAGLKFKFEEPDDDDEVLNDLERHADGSRGNQMRGMIEIVVAAPKITDERWNKIPMSAKLELANAAADYLGLSEDFLDESEVGRNRPQAGSR